MASKSVASGSKIMDISKPGKGSISTNSRSVVSGKSGAKDTTIKVEDHSEDAAIKVPAPSASRKVIKPLGDIDQDAQNPEETEIKVITNQPEPVQEPAPGELAEAQEQASKQVEEVPEDTANEPANQSVEPSEELPREDTPAEDPASGESVTNDDVAGEISENSDAAGVDELAKAAEAKRNAAKKAEEDAKRNIELDELAASKKYFVEIGHDSTKKASGKGMWFLVVAVVLLGLLAAVYLLADAGVVDPGFELPLDIIKN